MAKNSIFFSLGRWCFLSDRFVERVNGSCQLTLLPFWRADMVATPTRGTVARATLNCSVDSVVCCLAVPTNVNRTEDDSNAVDRCEAKDRVAVFAFWRGAGEQRLDNDKRYSAVDPREFTSTTNRTSSELALQVDVAAALPPPWQSHSIDE